MGAEVRVSEKAEKAEGPAHTMKAVVQEGYGSADTLYVRDIPMPELMEGRVLVRMRAASVNALDWHTTHGGLLLEIISKVMRQQDEPVRGVDLAGIVEAIGPNVTRFKPGDEVFGGAPACFAEYVRAREDRLLLKPRDLPFEQAATLGVAGRTALQGLRDHAQLKPGQRVLIHGAGGGVGTFAVQIAKALGAHVTAVTGPKNVDVIRSLGADEVIDYAKEDFTRRAERYDAVLDIAATLNLRSAARSGAERHVRAGRRGEGRLDRRLRADHQCDGARAAAAPTREVLRRAEHCRGPRVPEGPHRVRQAAAGHRSDLSALGGSRGGAVHRYRSGSSQSRYHRLRV